MSPITEAQMSRLFLSLNVQKSSLDVSNKLIKIVEEPSLKPLAHIHSLSLKTGIRLLFFFPHESEQLITFLARKDELNSNTIKLSLVQQLFYPVSP